MPELKGRPPIVFSESGSSLTIVLPVTIIIAIGITGFLGMARNNTNQEIRELNDEKAFLAAESELLIGTNWLRDSTNWNRYQNTGYNGKVHEDTINGFYAAVTVVPAANNELKIQACASGPGLPYTKALSWTVRQAQWNNQGIFINDCSHAGGVGGGGLNNEWFDGPVHSNSPIYISSVSGGSVNVKFVNGKVTVHNNTAQVPFASGGHWGNYGISNLSGNDYNFGIYMHDAHTGDFDKMDPLFLNNGQYSQFQHSKDSLYMPRITTQTRTLPAHQPGHDAILYFYVENGTGKADYYYYTAANTQATETFNVNDQVVRVRNDIKVLGTVKGQVTVVTDSGFNIDPVGDIVYSGYHPDNDEMNNYNNTDNYGLGQLSALNIDALALVAGGNINFGLDKFTLETENGTTALAEIAVHGGAVPTIYVTAQLLATEKNCGIRWVSTNVNHYNYKLRALGTRAVDVYEESHNSQGGPGSDAFRFYYDTRFLAGLKCPGVHSPRASSASRELFILNTNWLEESL